MNVSCEVIAQRYLIEGMQDSLNYTAKQTTPLTQINGVNTSPISVPAEAPPQWQINQPNSILNNRLNHVGNCCPSTV